MNPVARSLLYAFANILHPSMLWLMIWPMLIALAIWGTLLWIMGAQVVLLLSGWIHELIQSGTFLIRWDLRDAIAVTAKILIFLMFIPLVWLTALLILSTFGMPAMVEHVASRRFPQLARRRGGSIAGSIWNGVVALAGLIGLGLASIPLSYVVLKRLLAIVETVRAGDPFVAANAHRLQAIAWALLALQLLSLVIGAIAEALSTPAHPLNLDAGFSINGWLAVLLTFVLARVFAEGTLMREDLERTV